VRHTEGTPEYRVGAAQAAVPALVGAALAVCLVYLGLRWTADPMTATELRTCAHAVILATVAVVILPRSGGARLTPEHMVVFSHIGQGKRRIPWADITRIDVRRVLGVRQVSISLVTGKRLTLAAPQSFLDRRFDTRVEELTGWWETYRH
jgi:hypothetical protein